MDRAEELRKHLRTLSLVGAAIVASLVFYLGLVEVLRAVDRPFRGFAAAGDIRPVRFAVFGAAAAVILLIRILRPFLLRRASRDDFLAGLHKLQRATLLTLVLAEIPATLGLCLFLVAGQNVDFYILLVASVVLVFMYFPRRAAWEEWLRG